MARCPVACGASGVAEGGESDEPRIPLLRLQLLMTAPLAPHPRGTLSASHRVTSRETERSALVLQQYSLCLVSFGDFGFAAVFAYATVGSHAIQYNAYHTKYQMPNLAKRQTISQYDTENMLRHSRAATGKGSPASHGAHPQSDGLAIPSRRSFASACSSLVPLAFEQLLSLLDAVPQRLHL